MTALETLTATEAAQAVPVDPARPLLIVDVDEVLARFMEGFGTFVGRHGYEMRIDRFALFQNIYKVGAEGCVDMPTGKALFDDFFRDGADDLQPVEGAAAALERLSADMTVLILTNAPDHGRSARMGWLRTHGLHYPMIVNSGLKGPIVRDLAARTSGKVGFIDDLLPNLESVAADAPDVVRFQMIADERLRPYAPTDPARHVWADDWATMEPAIRAKLLA
ncbi:MAG: hypothetical protein JWR84_1204 [Caulobacter sp.]|nr:hypothetical protein [Caulobacter sp.]